MRWIRRSSEKSTSSMHEDRYPQGNLGKIEVSGNARFLWHLAVSSGETARRNNFQGMRNLNESARALRELLAQRILVLDGAMGTMLQQRNLTAADFGGAALEGCN